jgi:ribosome-associated heat shock protein Hsp15
MRLDDYLSTVFLIKRRTVAKEWVQAGKVKLNGKASKPGKEVRPGDRLEITYPRQKAVFEILEIPRKSVPKGEAEKFYKQIEV